MADISKLKALFERAKAAGKARSGSGPAGDVVRRATWTPTASKRNPNPSQQTLVEFAVPDRRPFSMGPGNVLAIAEQATKVTGKDDKGKDVTALDNILAMLAVTGGTWNKRTVDQLRAVRDYLEDAVGLAMAILEERTESKGPSQAPTIDVNALTPEQKAALLASLTGSK